MVETPYSLLLQLSEVGEVGLIRAQIDVTEARDDETLVQDE